MTEKTFITPHDLAAARQAQLDSKQDMQLKILQTGHIGTIRLALRRSTRVCRVLQFLVREHLLGFFHVGAGTPFSGGATGGWDSVREGLKRPPHHPMVG